ncbi:MAG: hypothetical protein WC838_00145 [Candidatus Margulisiibacteriota bacterium]
MESKDVRTFLNKMSKGKSSPVQKMKKIEYKMNYGRLSVVVSFSLN